MVPPCSVKITRVPTYLSQAQYHSEVFVYGAITLYRVSFHKLPLTICRLKGCSPFARRYWGNLGWFLFLWVLRYFSSPSSLLHPIYSDADTVETVGFPIRKSPDQSLFADSPKLIAGYNVLHRLWLPRHPPCTLSHLTIQPQRVSRMSKQPRFFVSPDLKNTRHLMCFAFWELF